MGSALVSSTPPSLHAPESPEGLQRLAHATGLDVEGAVARMGGHRTLYLRVLRKFAAACPQTLADLNAALASDDLPGIRRVAHTLKATAGAVGATSLYQSAHLLEELGAPRPASEVAPGSIQEAAERVQQELRFLMQHLPVATA